MPTRSNALGRYPGLAPELQEDFSSFCGATGRFGDENAARAFLDYRASLLEEGIRRGDA